MLFQLALPVPATTTEVGIEVKRYEPSIVIEPKKYKLVSKAVIKPSKGISSSGSNNYSQSLNSWLRALRMCESGSSGLYRANTGNGFYGAYQFMISTWDNVASKVRPRLVGVRPDLASPSDQDFMIVQNTKLSADGLASQNPGCYKKLGLSQFPPE